MSNFPNEKYNIEFTLAYIHLRLFNLRSSSNYSNVFVILRVEPISVHVEPNQNRKLMHIHVHIQISSVSAFLIHFNRS